MRIWLEGRWEEFTEEAVVSRQRERKGACDHLWPAAIMLNSANNTVTVKPCQRSKSSENGVDGRAYIHSSPGLFGLADIGTAVATGQLQEAIGAVGETQRAIGWRRARWVA